MGRTFASDSANHDVTFNDSTIALQSLLLVSVSCVGLLLAGNWTFRIVFLIPFVMINSKAEICIRTRELRESGGEGSQNMEIFAKP